jgi:hypothetical protein
VLRFQPEEMLRTLERHQDRSKEAANRDKDRQTLPTLRLLLEKLRSKPPEPS